MIRVFSNSIPRFWCALTFLGAVFSAANSTALETEECSLKVDWTSIYESGPDTRMGYDISFDLAEDGAGNIYVCGVESVPESPTIETGTQWRVEKFSADGTSLWVDKWMLSENGRDNEARKLALMPDGGIIVAGMGSPRKVVAVRRYDPLGKVLWTFTICGDGFEEWEGLCVAANDDGEVYVGATNYFPEVILIKLSENGTLIWANKPDIGGNGRLWDLAVSPSGDVVASGEIYDPVLDLNYIVMRIDPSGNLKWIWKDNTTLLSSGLGSVVMNPAGGCFYASGAAGDAMLAKFIDDPYATSGAPEWTGTYSGYYIRSIDIDSAGRVWGAGYRIEPNWPFKWTIISFGEDGSSDMAPPIVCTVSDYDWVEEHGLRPREDIEESSSFGHGIACTQDGGVVSCGHIWIGVPYGTSGETVKLLPAALHGTGPGPVANGSPTEPGPEHPGGLKPGDVRVAGGTRGLVDPRRGEGASVSVYPTSAGTVTLTVIDRRGGVVKQVSAPASGSGTVNLTWDGKNASGAPVAPGIYAVRVEGPGIRQVSKVAVVY